jgi:hypothetical protein
MGSPRELPVRLTRFFAVSVYGPASITAWAGAITAIVGAERRTLGS